MSTCNGLDLQRFSMGRPIMPKNLPNHCLKCGTSNSVIRILSSFRYSFNVLKRTSGTEDSRVLLLRRLTKLDSAVAPSLDCGVAYVHVRSCNLQRHLASSPGCISQSVRFSIYLIWCVGKVEDPK